MEVSRKEVSPDRPNLTVICIQCRLVKPAQGWVARPTSVGIFQFCEECWPNPSYVYPTKEEATANMVARMLTRTTWSLHVQHLCN